MRSLDYRINYLLSHTLPHPPYGDEREFYDLVAQGKPEEIERLKACYGSAPQPQQNEKGVLSPDPVRNAVYHLVANCTIITRRCISAGMPQEEAFTLSDMFIRRADRCTNAAEVSAVNDEMALEFAQRMKRLLGKGASPAMRRAVRFVCDNLTSPLSAAAVAQKTGYDRSYLSALFHRETGHTLSHFILLRRIEAAKSLIAGGLPLVEVSQLLCFSSQSHFCKCFKSVTGITPRKYKDTLV